MQHALCSEVSYTLHNQASHSPCIEAACNNTTRRHLPEYITFKCIYLPTAISMTNGGLVSGQQTVEYSLGALWNTLLCYGVEGGKVLLHWNPASAACFA